MLGTGTNIHPAGTSGNLFSIDIGFKIPSVAPATSTGDGKGGGALATGAANAAGGGATGGNVNGTPSFSGGTNGIGTFSTLGLTGGLKNVEVSCGLLTGGLVCLAAKIISLIVGCPCSIGLAFPTVIGTAQRLPMGVRERGLSSGKDFEDVALVSENYYSSSSSSMSCPTSVNHSTLL